MDRWVRGLVVHEGNVLQGSFTAAAANAACLLGCRLNCCHCACPLHLLAVWLSGIVQTILYCDFFYYYIKSWKNNQKLSLPA
jgi:hypothetical protein